MSDSNQSPQNPYAAPTEVIQTDPYVQQAGAREQLAGRFTRFAAAMVDGILVMLFIIPVQYLTGFLQQAQTGAVGIGEQLLMTAFGFLVMFALNGYLLANRGQTIGKFLTKIQIVDYQSDRLVSLSTILIYRYLWILPITILVIFIPGSTDDALIQLLSFLDVVLIFRADRRCLHDLLAGTHVVQFRANRDRLGVAV